MKKYLFTTLTAVLTLSTIFATLAFLPGCGGGNGGDVGSVGTLPLIVTAGRVTLSGVVLAPSGVTAAREAGRESAAAGQNTPLAGASVRVKRMKSDGSLESIGDNYSTTSDSQGNYSIPYVPKEENLIIEATRDVTVGGSQKTLSLRKATSITDNDTAGGTKTGLNLDTGATLTVEAMKDIVVTANQGKPESDKITAADLPRETIEEIETDMQTALAADQGSGTPTVDLVSAVTDGNTSLDAQLAFLENSANGTEVKAAKENASTKGSLRVHVVEINDQGPPVDEATVVVTNDGVVQTGATDAQGNAFFDGITPGVAVDVEVAKDGYAMVKTSQNIERAAVVHNVTVHVTKSASNQAPVAKAGPDQVLAQYATATFDASGSFDPDGDTISYNWTQTSGANITLSSSTDAKPAFTASAAGSFVFTLTVSDGTLTSETDTVTITVGAVACRTDSDCDDSNTLTLDSCANAGTTQSACGNTTFTCNTDSDCSDNNTATQDTCVNGGTANSSCTHSNITCSADTDCNDNNALTIDQCASAGTANAACSNTAIACNTNADCNDNNAATEDACANGGTLNAACTHANIACTADADCNDNNTLTLDQCANPGTAASSCSNTAIACSVDSDCDDADVLTADTCTNPGTVSASCSNTDGTPPSFSVIQNITSCGSGCLELTWTAATDAYGSTPITYNIYKAITTGAQNFTTPDYTTQNTTYQITGLTNDTPYYFVVRAKDSVGNEETNTTEKTGIPFVVVTITSSPVNPVTPGGWYTPCVHFDGSIFRMWAGVGIPNQVRYAISLDGQTWTTYPSVIIPAGDWYSGGISPITCMLESGVYKMYFEGGGGVHLSGYATSTDGINWNLYPGNPISSDERVHPNVINDGGSYKMWTNYYGPSPGYLHTSSDGASGWSLIGTTDIIAEAMKSGSIYQMWYNNSGLFEARSVDGINWTKNTITQVFPGINPSSTSMLKIGGTYHFWYHTDGSGDRYANSSGVFPPALTSVTISPNPAYVPLSGTLQFNATCNYAAVNPVCGSSSCNCTAVADWNSSNSGIATIGDFGIGGGDGLATGLTNGSSSITATVGGITSNTVTLMVGVTWATRASMSIERYGPCVAAVNGMVYSIGGSAGSDWKQLVEEYNPLTDAWMTKANMPTGRHSPACGVYNNSIYVAAGTYFSGYSSSLEAYDPLTNAWVAKAALTSTPRNVYGAFANGKFYLLGGDTAGVLYNLVDEYDPIANIWTPKTPMPTARKGVAVTVNNKIYVIGGYTLGASAGMNTVEEYDPVLDSWTTKATMPTARSGMATAVIDGKIYVIGGQSTGVILNAVEVYDPIANSWTSLAPAPFYRNQTGSTLIDNIVYIIGGNNEASLVMPSNLVMSAP